MYITDSYKDVYECFSILPKETTNYFFQNEGVLIRFLGVNRSFRLVALAEIEKRPSFLNYLNNKFHHDTAFLREDRLSKSVFTVSAIACISLKPNCNTNFCLTLKFTIGPILFDLSERIKNTKNSELQLKAYENFCKIKWPSEIQNLPRKLENYRMNSLLKVLSRIFKQNNQNQMIIQKIDLLEKLFSHTVKDQNEYLCIIAEAVFKKNFKDLAIEIANKIPDPEIRSLTISNMDVSIQISDPKKQSELL